MSLALSVTLEQLSFQAQNSNPAHVALQRQQCQGERLKLQHNQQSWACSFAFSGWVGIAGIGIHPATLRTLIPACSGASAFPSGGFLF